MHSQKVYVVTQAVDQMDLSKGERVIAVRLTFGSAQSICRLDGGRRIKRFEASKSPEPDVEGSAEGGSHGYQRTACQLD